MAALRSDCANKNGHSLASWGVRVCKGARVLKKFSIILPLFCFSFPPFTSSSPSSSPCPLVQTIMNDQGADTDDANIVTYDGTRTFEGDETITGFIVKNGLTTIKDNSFRSCSSLTSLHGMRESITSIGPGAFCSCRNLTSLQGIPETTVSIHEACFRFSGLTSLQGIPKLTSIESRVFSGCSSLTSLRGLPETLKSIGDHAFDDCCGLTSLTGMPGVISLGQSCLRGTGITSLKGLPSTVWSIGDCCFDSVRNYRPLSDLEYDDSEDEDELT